MARRESVRPFGEPEGGDECKVLVSARFNVDELRIEPTKLFAACNLSVSDFVRRHSRKPEQTRGERRYPKRAQWQPPLQS